MTDRPILYSKPMVKASIAGTKRQTRRLAGVPKIEQMPSGLWHIHTRGGGVVCVAEEDIGAIAANYLPIQPGDRLWVKETWRAQPFHDTERPSDIQWHVPIHYEADGTDDSFGRIRVSIHMCEWMSRLTQHVTEVRVQRLHDISEEDALAEGIGRTQVEEMANGVAYEAYGSGPTLQLAYDNPRDSYASLWEHINGPGSWDANPLVAVYSFEVERANIAEARSAESHESRSRIV